MKAPISLFHCHPSAVFPGPHLRQHLTSISTGSEVHTHTHTHTHRGNHHCSLFHKFAGIPQGEKTTPTSYISSTDTSCSSLCSYFKAEFHPATGTSEQRPQSWWEALPLCPRKASGMKGVLITVVWNSSLLQWAVEMKWFVWGSWQWWQQHRECMVACQLVPSSSAPLEERARGVSSLGWDHAPLPHCHHFWRLRFQRVP